MLFAARSRRGTQRERKKDYQIICEKNDQHPGYVCKKAMKENFYHGILLGLLGYKDTWVVSPNEESGEGL